MPSLISVIIPTHNCAPTIGTAIKSIVLQIYPNLEIIVVDDNSGDNTEEIVAQYSKKYNNIKYYKLPYKDPNRVNKRGRNINAGYMARNYGLEKVRGDWITFQDADDGSLTNRIEVQYNLALEYKSSHVCIHWQKLKEEYVGKKLDVDRIFREKKNIVVETAEILKIARKAKGPIIKIIGALNEKIPFEIKRKRIINKLFFGSLAPYPTSGNSPLVKRKVIEKIKFNPLHKRIRPSFMGRGVDRDFNFRVAEEFKDSVSFNLPLYLYKSENQNTFFLKYEKYLID